MKLLIFGCVSNDHRFFAGEFFICFCNTFRYGRKQVGHGYIFFAHILYPALVKQSPLEAVLPLLWMIFMGIKIYFAARMIFYTQRQWQRGNIIGNNNIVLLAREFFGQAFFIIVPIPFFILARDEEEKSFHLPKKIRFGFFVNLIIAFLIKAAGNNLIPLQRFYLALYTRV